MISKLEMKTKTFDSVADNIQLVDSNTHCEWQIILWWTFFHVPEFFIIIIIIYHTQKNEIKWNDFKSISL